MLQQSISLDHAKALMVLVKKWPDCRFSFHRDDIKDTPYILNLSK